MLGAIKRHWGHQGCRGCQGCRGAGRGVGTQGPEGV